MTASPHPRRWRWPADLAVVLLLLGLAAGATLAWVPSGAGGRAVVEVGGDSRAYLRLDRADTVRVRGLRGVSVIVSGGGRVGFVESACPHELCVRMSPASRGGELLLCVPNGVTVHVLKPEDEDGVDAVVG